MRETINLGIGLGVLVAVLFSTNKVERRITSEIRVESDKIRRIEKNFLQLSERYATQINDLKLEMESKLIVRPQDVLDAVEELKVMIKKNHQSLQAELDSL